MSKSRTDASELLSGLAAIVDDEARQGTQALGERVALRMALEWGGQRVYISFDNVRRDNFIYDLFDGKNYNQLARRFHLSENRTRQIISRERARRRHKQLTFFKAV